MSRFRTDMGFGPRQKPPAGSRNASSGGGLPLAVGSGTEANPDKLGLTLPARAPAPTVPQGPRTTPINNALTWLINALGLNNSSIPTDLGVAQVTPTLEVGGNGWPLATYAPFTFVTPGNPVSFNFGWLTPPDPNNTQVLVGFLATQTTLAQPALVISLFISGGTVSPPTAPGTMLTASNLNTQGFIGQGIIPASPDATHLGQLTFATIVGGLRFIVAPPGFGIVYSEQNVLAGQVESVNCLIAKIPGAFAAGR